MRTLVALMAAATVSRCAEGPSIEDVRTRLSTYHVGKSVDQLVLGFGPHAATHTLSDGSKMLEWKLSLLSTITDSRSNARSVLRRMESGSSNL